MTIRTAATTQRPRRARQAGFSMVEIAVVLVVLGLLGWTVSSAYGNAALVRDRDAASRTGEGLRETLRLFALQNARLPCPDTTATGWETNGPAGACADARQAGWLPYRTLGLDVPEPGLRAGYAVYRNAGAVGGDADLAVRSERTGDLAGTPRFRDSRDLVVALQRVVQQPVSVAHTRLTGDGAGDGGVDCVANIRSHPAFLLVVPLTDRDNDGDRFDSVHAPAAGAAGFSPLCGHAPTTAISTVSDDVVTAEPASVLAGWLTARAP